MTGMISNLKQHQSLGGKLVIFCAGLHGVEFYEILKVCGIFTDFFSDKDEKKWDTVITDNVRCVSPATLKEYNCKGFICVGHSHYNEVYSYVSKNSLFSIIEISDIMDCLIKNNRSLFIRVIREHARQTPADVFYDIKPNQSAEMTNHIPAISTKRIAVYTAVFGDYDEYRKPHFFSDNLDYFCVSDKKPAGLQSNVKWIDANTVIPSEINSPIKRNRYVKMHPHLIFGDYEWSVYIDGNVRVMSDISSFAIESKAGISVFSHPMRECIYYEALSICNFRRVNVDDVCNQMERYFEEGMPMRYGLMEMPVISRDHNKQECISIMDTWWDEFNRGAQRDQLSFMYAMWKNGMTIQDVACLGNDVRNDNRLMFYKHVYESKNIKNDV